MGPGTLARVLQRRRGTGNESTHNPLTIQKLMIELAIIFAVLALIAAIFGFGGIASSFAGIARILLIIFIILAIVTFVL